MKCTNNKPQSDISPDNDQIYTVKDIAEILRISERGAYNFVNTSKDFKVLRIGRCLRVSKASFDSWLNGESAASE